VLAEVQTLPACIAGAVEYLAEHYDLKSVQFVGASAGALVATLGACGVSPEVAVACAYRYGATLLNPAVAPGSVSKYCNTCKAMFRSGVVVGSENGCFKLEGKI